MASVAHDRVNFTFSMDKATRDSYNALCDTWGLSMSAATLALVKQAVRDQKITLSAVDENGFTPEEAIEIKRRFNEIKAGHYETHDLIEDES